jgi:dihydroxyacid dehydratase/phosphogluconate dehydratase
VIKPAAADARLHKHRGKAIVFESYGELSQRIDDPALEVDEDSVLVLKNAGPLGGPGMPEWGQLPIPKKLLERGVRDMLRISDCRMSGTSFGACVLHVAPESYIGGPLALVRSGDLITLDVEARSLHLHVGEEELERRRAEWTPPPTRYARGYGAIFQQNVTQANEGCDFAVLAARDSVPEPDIY